MNIACLPLLHHRLFSSLSLTQPVSLSMRTHSRGSKVTAVSVHPGVITQTKLYRSSRPIFSFVVKLFVADKDIPQGAATTVWALVSPRVQEEEMRGSYLVDCSPALPLTAQGRDEDGSAARELAKVTLDALQKATGRKLV